MILKSIKDCSSEEINSFDCENDQLNIYLKSFALKNDHNGYGKTYVLFDEDKTIGYFTLCSAQINYSDYPNIDCKKLPRYPIPCIKIARLAVDRNQIGKGYGKLLLKKAFEKILFVSSLVGIYLIVVDAKESSISFYEKYGFKNLLNEKATLFLNIETLKKAM